MLVFVFYMLKSYYGYDIYLNSIVFLVILIILNFVYFVCIIEFFELWVR